MHSISRLTAFDRSGISLAWMVLVVLLLLLAIHSRTAHASAPSSNQAPNIIVVFVDDMGYADVGAQGQVKDLKTPHLDQFAEQGVRCTDGYITAPQCSPSRAGLVTGRYQQRFGIDTIPDCPLPLNTTTIAERLQRAGYKTGMVGKWHLNPNGVCLKWARENLPNVKPTRGRIRIPLQKSLQYYPRHHGFDEYFVGEHQRYYANFQLHVPDDRAPKAVPKNKAKQPPAPVEKGAFWVDDSRYRLDIQVA